MILYFLTVLWICVVWFVISYNTERGQKVCDYFRRFYSKFCQLFRTMGELNENNPSIERQREILSCKLAKSVLAGETWYLVNTKWMKNLKLYIGVSKSSERVINPGPIDNSSILAENGTDLKKGLAENIDYDLIPEECWHLLVEWYGYYRHQMPIHRQAIELTGNYTMVEVYMLELHCYKSFDLLHEKKISVSKTEKMSTVHNLIREKYVIKKIENTRLWVSLGSNDYDLINLQLTVQEAILSNRQYLVLEVQSSAGYWSRSWTEKATKSTSIEHSSSKQSKVPAVTSRSCLTSSVHKKVLVKPGVCGLYNLGNTCFMNSVIQCMSNSSPVTEYFLSGCHLAELNVENPMGMQGEIAKAYGDLIQALWSGRNPSTNPLNFKVQVSKFNPQFCGCQQHDAQELLTFLLDGLHEDLNRITVKPYVPNKDYTGQDDHVFAAETWSNYQLRNDSIIVDTFHGLLKSRVICPQCERLSVAFDPFCTLSLPLPQNKEQHIKVKYIPYNSKKKEVLFRIVLPKKCLFRDLCNEISEKTQASASQMVVAEVINNHIHSFFSPDDHLELYEDRDLFYIYELNVNPYLNEYVVVPVYFWESCRATDIFTYNHLFAVPLLAVFQIKIISKKVVERTVYNLMRRHFCLSYNKESSDTDDDTSPERGYSNRFYHRPTLCVIDSSMADGNVPITLYNNVSVLLESHSDCVFSRKILIVNFLIDEKHLWYFEQDPEYGHDYHTPRSTERGRLSINDCFDLFTTCEKLGVENAWLCPTCKVQQRATKKFDLWMLPKILIIHLKRFSYAKGGDKIDALIEFPLYDLRLAKYIINPSQQDITYNLIAVINHYGTMTGGHYTAFCKNKNSGLWYIYDDDTTGIVKEDDVLTPAAYVLFYMRNDHTLCDTPMETV